MLSFYQPKMVVYRLFKILVWGYLFLPVYYSYGQNTALTLTTTSSAAQAAFVAGRDLAENQHTTEARTYFSKAIAKDANCAMAYLYLAQVSPQSGAAYTQNLRRAVALAPKVTAGERLLILAEQAEAEGQTTKAEELLKKVVQQYPDEKRMYLALASFYLRQADYQAAENTLKTGFKLTPDFPPFSLWLGQIAAIVGKFPEATNAIQTYQQLLPNEANGYVAAGNLLLKKGQYPAGVKQLEQALQLDSGFYAAYLGLSAGYLLQNKPEAARQQAQKLYDLAPNEEVRRQALAALSNSYLDEGKFDKALAEAKKSRELAEKSQDTAALIADLNQLGNIYLAQGNTTEAQAHYSQALAYTEKADSYAEVKLLARRRYLAHEAEIALTKKDLVTARKKINEYQQQATGRKNATEVKEAHRLRGMLALQEKQYETALQELRQADQHNPRTLYLIGSAYLTKGNKAQARLHWATAAQFNQMQYDYLLIRRKASL